MDRVAVFVNPAARAGRRRARTAATAAAIAAISSRAVVDIIEPTSALDVVARAAKCVAEGRSRIVAVGGDGLFHQVVQAIAGTDTIAGLVPLGTGNDFAAALGLPRDPEQAATVALGADRRIDLLHSAAGWAASVATVGFSATVNERAEVLRWPRGPARYSVATVLSLPGLRPVPLELTLEDAPGPPSVNRVDAALVAVGNTALFGGGMRICPDARPDDGLLDVTVIEAVGRADLLRHFGRVFRGTHVRHHAVSVHRARAVTLTAVGVPGPPPAVVCARADGEAWGELPLRIEVVPGALRVAAPGPSPSA